LIDRLCAGDSTPGNGPLSIYLAGVSTEYRPTPYSALWAALWLPGPALFHSQQETPPVRREGA